MLQKLQSGQKKVSEIPAITVVHYEDQVYSIDNRRLWIFKHCLLPSYNIEVLKSEPDHRFFGRINASSEHLVTSSRSVVVGTA